MQEFEKLGAFYLGRAYDAAAKRAKDNLLLYDSKDLLTHAVCFGMTGSGKTGLCIGVLEEAAIDGIPAIAIDPKGDLSNLLLTFPHLAAEEFRPWINTDEARAKGISEDQFAAAQAQLWTKGLAEWGQDAARIARLRAAADFAIYTPGSGAGRPVSVVRSFAAPAKDAAADRELMRERVSATAASLLALLGIDADPLKSREHILIATLLDNAWKQGQSLDLTALVQQIQAPPVKRIGALDVDSFFPAKDRFELSMSLNNLLASPGFEAWMEGEPLDIGALLHTAEGKPRVTVFSIAHLSDAERMFFVSLLLNAVLGWMRSQSGTASLRALLYMDEIFGYFPPTANPPSKTPLLTLLKQARAFGLGVMLATQNPVDLDYKGLSNCGTWFIGRLQTERDKARVLDGLEGAAEAASMAFNREQIDRLLSGLGSRVFLMNNVHEDAPEVFQTRWTLSYLRGPLTREQIKALSGANEQAPTAAPAADAGSNVSEKRPLLPPDVPQFFLPVRGAQPAGAALVYEAALAGAAKIHFSDVKTKVEADREIGLSTPITDEATPVCWDNNTPLDFAASDLENAPQEGASFAEVAAAAAKPRNYASWNRDFAAWLFRNQTLELFKSASGAISNAGESERDFRIRTQQGNREDRDRQVEALRASYAPKMQMLQERIRRAGLAKERETAQATAQKFNTAISVGATLLGAFLGRKTVSMSTLGKAATAARAASRTMKESQDVQLAEENVQALQQQLADLDTKLKAEIASLQAKIDPQTEKLETVTIRPKKANIAVALVALVWMPYWQTGTARQPAWE